MRAFACFLAGIIAANSVAACGQTSIANLPNATTAAGQKVLCVTPGTVGSSQLCGPQQIVSAVSAPVYNDTIYNSGQAILQGGINPAAEFANSQGGFAATDALTVGITVPSTAANHQANAIAAYVVSQRGSYSGGGGDVAGYFQIRSAANNSNVFSLNPVVSDTPGFTGQRLQNEFDYNVAVAGTSVPGTAAVLDSSVNPFANGWQCRNASISNWNTCFYVPDGSAGIALYAGATGTGNNQLSTPVMFGSRSSGGVNYTAKIFGDQNGGLDFTAGAAGGGIGFNDQTGNLGFINSTGFHGPLYLTIGMLPSISSCGTAPSVNAGSTSAAGEFTTGTGAPTTCTIGFATNYPTHVFCTVSPASSYAGTYYISIQNVAGFAITLSAGASATNFSYNCGGN